MTSIRLSLPICEVNVGQENLVKFEHNGEEHRPVARSSLFFQFGNKVQHIYFIVHVNITGNISK